MLVKSTFLILLSSAISATIAAPVAQAPDAVSVIGSSPAPTASADPANLDPANLDPAPVESSAPGIDFDAASVPSSSVAPLPVSSSIIPAPPLMTLKPVHIPPKHELPPVHITTSTLHHIPPPVHTPIISHIPPPVHHIPPPVHHTTSTFHHVPVHTPIHVPPPPVHHTTPIHHVVPTPIHHIPPPVHTPVHVPVKHVVFDKWGGHDSLKGFDDFYGVDNWDGYKFEQVFVKPQHELVCKVHPVHIIQQRLLVLQEMAKKIIVETVCEVEVQTIVFEQWYAGLHGFGRDIRRYPGKHHQVGYDQEIVKHFPKFINEHDLSLNLDDWHFTGKDLGKHTVIVKGHDWDDKRSPALVWKAWGAARQGWHDVYGKWF